MCIYCAHMFPPCAPPHARMHTHTHTHTEVYKEVPAKLLGNAPRVDLNQNSQMHHYPKYNCYRDMDRRRFKESELLHVH
jgi:hypothetical protein